MTVEPVKPGRIFISYRHGLETDFALKLAADLKNAGLDVWVDRLDGITVGQEWRESIQRAIHTCAAFLPVLSPDYVESAYCRNELARADEIGKPIFPVLLRTVSAREWPLAIQRLQYEDFSSWRVESAYSVRFESLLARLAEAQRGQAPTPPDPETQYLTNLIATAERKRGVIEYVELGAEADTLEENRPEPLPEDEWGYVWLLPAAPSPAAAAMPDNAASLSSSFPSSPPRQRLTGVAEAVDRLPRFVLTGEPGAGKSTAMRRIARDAARRRLAQRDTAPLPVLLELPSWRNEPSPADFVQAHWPFRGDAAESLKNGNACLLLDGLNEMGAGAQGRVGQLKQWLASAEGPARVIIACRTGDYASETLRLGGLPTVVIQNLEKEQIRAFAANYLHERAPAFLDRVLPKGELLVENHPYLADRDLTAMVRNPYMLSALIFLFDHSPGGQLPRNTGSLFRGFSRALWERERKRGTPGWIPYEQAERAFAALAYSMIDEAKGTTVPVDYALKKLGDAPQLLLAGESASYFQRDGDSTRFFHQLLQEYFAAVGLRDAGKPAAATEYRYMPGGVRSDPLLWQGRQTSKWDEVQVALSGIVDRPDEFVAKLLESDPYLAGRCVESGVLLDPITRTKTLDRLIVTLHGNDWLAGTAALKALQILRDQDAAPGLVSVLLKDQVPPSTVDPREMAAVALGSIGGPVAVRGLMQALESASFRVRVRAALSLGQMGDPVAAPALVGVLWDDSATYIYFSSSRCLGRIAQDTLLLMGDRAPQSVVPALLDGLRNLEPRIRCRSAELLGRLGDLAAVASLEAAQTWDVDDRVRGAAGYARQLIYKSTDPCGSLRGYREASDVGAMHLSDELQQMAGTNFIGRLLHALAHEADSSAERFIRTTFQNTFDTNKERIVLALIDQLASKDSGVRALAVDLLGSSGSVTAIQALERARDDPGGDLIRHFSEAIIAIRRRNGLAT